MQFLAIMVNGHWRPGVGDPDFVSWVITIAYFIAVGFCFWAWRRERAAKAPGLAPFFWLAAAVLLVLLGFNKQLDLQSWVIEVGKEMAEDRGVYAHRRKIQLAFILLMAGGSLAALAVTAWLLRRVWRRYWLAFAGFVLLAAFVLMRASTFNHVDEMVAHESWDILLLRNTMELTGVVLVGARAWLAARQRYTPRLRAFETTVRIR